MALVIDNSVIIAQRKNLEAVLSTDPKMQDFVRARIREALLDARYFLFGAFPAESDPRRSVRAIRTSVYRKILGGNINILSPKSEHGGSNGYQPPRTLRPGQRGGNRRKRSPRTIKIQNYPPLDRGFILRFLNSGTAPRFIGFRNTVKKNRDRYQALADRIGNMEHSHTGHRGSISPRNWFVREAESRLGDVAQYITDIITQEAAKVLGSEA